MGDIIPKMIQKVLFVADKISITLGSSCNELHSDLQVASLSLERDPQYVEISNYEIKTFDI